MINKASKSLNTNKIKDEILILKKKLLNFHFQKSSGQLEKTDQIRKTKRDIAKLKFQISQNIGDKNA